MELLGSLKDCVQNAIYYKKSKNFYFEYHICEKTGNNKKVNLDFKLSTEKSDQIMKFGMCPECKTVFYYYDFESKSI